MTQIINVCQLNNKVSKIDVFAPLIATKAKAGQFVILRIREGGKRIPLSIASVDKMSGIVSIVFEKIGVTTLSLSELKPNDTILDFVGPLGNPTGIKDSNILLVTGGVSFAIADFIIQTIKQSDFNSKITLVGGFREEESIISPSDIKYSCEEILYATDDGSLGYKGSVVDVLKKLIDEDKKEYDSIYAMGSLTMMRAVSRFAKERNIKTLVSLNPIMLDGTGMCGGCRVKVDGKIKFACVDGPDFDGLKVDFDTLINRTVHFYENASVHQCRLDNLKQED